jgi:hypothetical protein
MTSEKIKRHKSQGIDKIPTELIIALGTPIYSDIHKLINSMWSKEKLPK